MAGSPFSRCQRQHPDIPRPWQSSWRAQRAIFSRVWAFGTPKSEFFSGPQGHYRGICPRLGYRLSKSWQKSWVLVVSRLTRSCIEYVILAGSPFSRCQRQNPDIPRPWQSSWRAQRAIFLRIWAFGTPKSEIFAGPQGHLAMKAGLPAL